MASPRALPGTVASGAGFNCSCGQPTQEARATSPGHATVVHGANLDGTHGGRGSFPCADFNPNPSEARHVVLLQPVVWIPLHPGSEQ